MMIMLMIIMMNEFADCHMWLIGLGSPFSLHSPSAGGIEVFCFCDIDSLIGNSIWSPPVLPQLYFPTQVTLHFAAFLPCASVMFTINLLFGSKFCFVRIDSYLCFAFFRRALKAQEGENFHWQPECARELSFGGFKVLQSVALSTFHVCFCMVLPWKRSGFLYCSTEGWSFALFHLTRMIRKPIPLCFKSLKPNGVLARILTVSHPIIERSASEFWLLVCFSWL